MGGLQGASGAGPGDDGRCAECESAPAAGPCAACEAMICGDCGIMSRDPGGVRVICHSCARLIAGVRERAPRRAPWITVVAVGVVIAFGLVALSALGCSSGAGTASAPEPKPAATATAAPDAGAPDAAAPVEATRYLRVVEPPAGAGALPGSPVVAARVFAFADTQLHYLFGKRTFAQSPFADRMSFEVAIRPAAVDDGSDLLMAAFIDDWKQRWPDASLVFLGDAADLSCTQEFDAFTRILRDRGADRLLAVTSNHDGFFVGNFTSKRDLDGMLAATDMPDDWTRACSEPGSFRDHRLTKGRAVARLEALLPEAPLWATSAAHRGAYGPTDFARAHLYYTRPLGGGDAGAPPVWGLFVDTVDYRDFDLHASQGAGTNGAISRQQMRFLDRAMFEAKGAASIGRTRFVAFGHHPLAELEPKSRARLLAFLDVRPEVLAYVAAHTHSPMEREVVLPSGRRIPEIIVGSTTDAPHAAGLLEIQIAGSRAAVARHRLYFDRERVCQNVAALPPTVLGYTGYRILRDGVPDLDIGTLDKLMFAVGLSELEGQRVVQVLGALLVENELVRSWAHLYRSADMPEGPRLAAITGRRYAAGKHRGDLEPWLSGRARPGRLDSYQRWWDPVGARIVRVAQLALHRFGPHADAFRSLRAQRAGKERWFMCHAAHGAAAEIHRQRRRGKILYIR